jgi:hypothetical protein
MSCCSSAAREFFRFPPVLFDADRDGKTVLGPPPAYHLKDSSVVQETRMAPPVYQLKAEFFKTLGHPARIRILEGGWRSSSAA